MQPSIVGARWRSSTQRCGLYPQARTLPAGATRQLSALRLGREYLGDSHQVPGGSSHRPSSAGASGPHFADRGLRFIHLGPPTMAPSGSPAVVTSMRPLSDHRSTSRQRGRALLLSEIQRPVSAIAHIRPRMRPLSPSRATALGKAHRPGRTDFAIPLRRVRWERPNARPLPLAARRPGQCPLLAPSLAGRPVASTLSARRCA